MYQVNIPDKVNKKIQALEQVQETMSEVRENTARNAAFYYRRKIKEHIRNQDLPWEPLDEDYLEFKESMGYDTRIWIARGILRKNVKVVKYGHADYRVEIPPEAEYPDGMNVKRVMQINEYGTMDGRIPARPLFRPTRKEVRKRLVKEVEKTNKRIIQALTKDYNLNNISSITPTWKGE